MINPPQGCDDRVRGSHRIAIESEQGHSRGRSLTKLLSLVETNSVFAKGCSKIQYGQLEVRHGRNQPIRSSEEGELG